MAPRGKLPIAARRRLRRAPVARRSSSPPASSVTTPPAARRCREVVEAPRIGWHLAGAAVPGFDEAPGEGESGGIAVDGEEGVGDWARVAAWERRGADAASRSPSRRARSAARAEASRLPAVCQATRPAAGGRGSRPPPPGSASGTATRRRFCRALETFSTSTAIAPSSAAKREARPLAEVPAISKGRAPQSAAQTGERSAHASGPHQREAQVVQNARVHCATIRSGAEAAATASLERLAFQILLDDNNDPSTSHLSERDREILRDVILGLHPDRRAGELASRGQAAAARAVGGHHPQRHGRPRGAGATRPAPHLGRPGADRRPATTCSSRL